MHQVHGPKCMVKPIVNGSGIDEMTQAQLAYSAQPLDPWMIKNLCEIGVSDLNKAIHWIIEQLGSGSHRRNLARFFASAAIRQNNCDELPLKES